MNSGQEWADDRDGWRQVVTAAMDLSGRPPPPYSIVEILKAKKSQTIFINFYYDICYKYISLT